MAYIVDDIVRGLDSAGAARLQEDQAQKALALQQRQYNQSREDQQPYMQAGQQSLADMMSGINSGSFNTAYTPVNAQNLQNDPGYQFRMQQAQQALERSAAAGGRLNSGGFMKGLDQYSQGLASQEYQSAWQRNMGDFQARQGENQARFGRLSGIAGMGLNSAENLGGLGQSYANSASNLYGAIGNAKAAALMGFSNATANGIQSMGNMYMQSEGMGGGGGSPLGSIGGQAPSASGNYGANPNQYSLGNYNLQQPSMTLNVPNQYGSY